MLASTICEPTRAKVLGVERPDGRTGAHGHEPRRLEDTVRSMQDSGAGRSVRAGDAVGDRNHDFLSM